MGQWMTYTQLVLPSPAPCEHIAESNFLSLTHALTEYHSKIKYSAIHFLDSQPNVLLPSLLSSFHRYDLMLPILHRTTTY